MHFEIEVIIIFFFLNSSGTYEIQEAENVSRGTKIVLHLKPECREFADETRIADVIKKYSNFVNYPILLNKKKTNTIQVYISIFGINYVPILKNVPEIFVRFLTVMPQIFFPSDPVKFSWNFP